GHYDSVIHDYRESLLTTLPPTNSNLLVPLLNRIYALLPNSPQIPLEGNTTPSNALTHVLHLAPHGEILPHVDHVEASGGVIVGISIGAERVLRLVRKAGIGWEVRLQSGSLYIQRDTVRYEYEHSILPYEHEASVWDGKRLQPGHRVSIMVRVSFTFVAVCYLLIKNRTLLNALHNYDREVNCVFILRGYHGGQGRNYPAQKYPMHDILEPISTTALPLCAYHLLLPIHIISSRIYLTRLILLLFPLIIPSRPCDSDLSIPIFRYRR
ncbi:hypothetical protein BCR39DRAFT_468092, partial [Naematelia encephala]